MDYNITGQHLNFQSDFSEQYLSNKSYRIYSNLHKNLKYLHGIIYLLRHLCANWLKPVTCRCAHA